MANDCNKSKILNQDQVWDRNNGVSDSAFQSRGLNFGYKTTTQCFIKAKAVWASITIGLTCFYLISKKILHKVPLRLVIVSFSVPLRKTS